MSSLCGELIGILRIVCRVPENVINQPGFSTPRAYGHYNYFHVKADFINIPTDCGHLGWHTQLGTIRLSQNLGLKYQSILITGNLWTWELNDYHLSLGNCVHCNKITIKSWGFCEDQPIDLELLGGGDMWRDTMDWETPFVGSKKNNLHGFTLYIYIYICIYIYVYIYIYIRG